MELVDDAGEYRTTVCFFAAPVDDGEACPITGEALGAPALTGHENDHVVSARPALNAVRLECGHRFNALALLYHWTCTHMRCPMCRRGSERALAAGSFEEPWAEQWAAAEARRRKLAGLDSLHADESTLQGFVQEAYVAGSLRHEFVINVHHWEDLLDLLPDVDIPQVVHEVSTIVYFYEMHDDGLYAHHSESISMHADGTRYVTNPASMRHVGRVLAHLRPSHIRLASFAVQLGGAILVFAYSPVVAMRDVHLAGQLEARDTASGTVYTIHGLPGDAAGIGSVAVLPPASMNLLLV